jgi:mandelate racemase
MAGVRLTIESISARPVLAPLPRPIRTAVGTIPSAPLVLIDVVTNQGIVGRSYIFAYTPPALAPLVRFIEEITPELKGKPVVPVERMHEFDRRFRLIGWQGLIGMAVSGLDMAFWDAIARMLDQPVVRLLGGAPMPLQAYESYGLIDPTEDEKAILRSVEQGFRGIKIKVGEGDLNRDLATVGAVRAMIGPDIALMVDYNQSLDPVEASRRIARLAQHDLHWVEEPVRADDIHGHAQVRAASAGVSGWMRAMGQADAASLPVSSHIIIEASAHVLAVTPTVHWLEHLDLAGTILAEPYQAVDGR